MKLEEFKIGEEFVCGGRLWKCTDIGTRVVVAIRKLDDWGAGPPYDVAETVFDEDDILVCSKEPR